MSSCIFYLFTIKIDFYDQNYSPAKYEVFFKQELDEDVIITLVAKNPKAPQNKIRFDHTKGEYVEIKLVERMIDHLEIESTMIHKDSAEGKKQMQIMGGAPLGQFTIYTIT